MSLTLCYAEDVDRDALKAPQWLPSWLDLFPDKRKEARSQSMVPERSPSSICKLPPQRSLDIPLELEEPPADVLIDPSSIVTSEEANYLSQHYLPARHVGNQWHLLFSTESHGFSLSTIYR